MSVLRVAVPADRPSVSSGVFRLQDILAGRLGNGSGAGAVVEIPGRAPLTGRWLVRGNRYLVELDTPMGPPAGLGRLRVNLPTGVHAFGAWLRPVDDNCVEVYPHNQVDVQERRGAVRVPVDLPGQIAAADGTSSAEVTVRDLSVTGAGFGGLAKLSVGQACTLRVEGALGVHLGALPGEIVWRDPAPEPHGFRYGMRFAERRQLSDHIYAWLSEMRRRT